MATSRTALRNAEAPSGALTRGRQGVGCVQIGPLVYPDGVPVDQLPFEPAGEGRPARARRSRVRERARRVVPERPVAGSGPLIAGDTRQDVEVDDAHPFRVDAMTLQLADDLARQSFGVGRFRRTLQRAVQHLLRSLRVPVCDVTLGATGYAVMPGQAR